MHPLKSIAVFICTVIMMTGAFNSDARAQTRVTGHVFAEVVETVGASANTANLASLSQPGATFDLGEIALNGGSMAAFTVVIESGEMVGQSGERASFNARTNDGKLVSSLDPNGRQVVRFRGSANEENAAGNERNFSAAYSVTLAYN